MQTTKTQIINSLELYIVGNIMKKKKKNDFQHLVVPVKRPEKALKVWQFFSLNSFKYGCYKWVKEYCDLRNIKSGLQKQEIRICLKFSNADFPSSGIIFFVKSPGECMLFKYAGNKIVSTL